MPLANVPLSRSRNQFVVTASLDGQREVRLLIDTGASVTFTRWAKFTPTTKSHLLAVETLANSLDTQSLIC